jgi:hypothetical protein
MSEPVGELSQIVHELLHYLRGKGQVYSAVQLASLIAVKELLEARYGVELKPLSTLVKMWIELSEIEASRWTTVAQKNVETVTKINTNIQYIEQKERSTRVLPLFRK